MQKIVKQALCNSSLFTQIMTYIEREIKVFVLNITQLTVYFICLYKMYVADVK